MNTLKIFLAIVAGSAELAVYANDIPESPQKGAAHQRAENLPQQLQQNSAPMKNGRSLSLADTPKSVQQSVRKNAGAGLVSGVEKGTLNGETVYNVMFDNHGRFSEYTFDQNGKVLSQSGRPISEAAGAPNGRNNSERPQSDDQHNHRILQHPK